MSLIGCPRVVEQMPKSGEPLSLAITILAPWIRTASSKPDFAGRCRTETEPSPPPRLLVLLLSARPAFILPGLFLCLIRGVPVCYAVGRWFHGRRRAWSCG